MKNNHYYQLRTRSTKEVELEQLEFQVEESQQQIDGDILATKRSLASAKQELSKAESAYPFNSKNVIDAELKIEGFEAGLERLQKIRSRLFDEELGNAEMETSQESQK